MTSGTGTAEISPRRRKIIEPPSVGPRAAFRGLRELAEYGDLLSVLTAHRIRVRYKQTALGAAWTILQPLALMLIYTAIFSHVAKVPSDGLPYALFAFAGLLPWVFFSSAVTSATSGLVSHTNLITKVYFPREILPLTYVVASLFDFAVAALVLGVMMLAYGVRPTTTALVALLMVALLVAIATAIALLFSALQVRFRDVGLTVPLILQVWMFATPIVYPLAAVPEPYRPLFLLNPITGPVEGFRRALLLGAMPDPSTLVSSIAVAALLLPVSYVLFKRAETTIADVI
jgi:lipopolysaccharide transport system permease protein